MYIRYCELGRKYSNGEGNEKGEKLKKNEKRKLIGKYLPELKKTGKFIQDK